MSAETARQALYDAIEQRARRISDEIAPGEALVKLANAWALLQPDEPEDEPEPPVHQVGSTQFLPFGAGAEYDGYEERARVIGFTPNR